ncbi:hypothetical protein [Modestobacter roseus]|uniref:Uncharacterized protein n=1 Tax=Modestobacter roseus TaxID=1181884 RepID=A0A562IRD4_9ACTN|nr:hypothetical protein [Modestobacter roseus]MQA34652.1 hypothetical protein [Modestobacter roseus]TWH73124.1 hypothetical protein JD78_01647 [Modestobacter roseus]
MTGPATGRYRLESDDLGVTALDASGRPVAHVEVRADDAAVRLEFWLAQAAPRHVRTELTRSVFRHAALRPRRAVLAAVPHGEPDVLAELRAHVSDTRTHVAGATCLLEGRVR